MLECGTAFKVSLQFRRFITEWNVSEACLRLQGSECVCRVCRLGKELDDLKKRRAAVRASLKTQVPESARPVQSGKYHTLQEQTHRRRYITHYKLYTMSVSPAPLAKPLENPKATELSGRLSQLDKDLVLAETDMQNRMRAPLNNSNPAGDLSNRLKEQEVRTG